MIKKKLRISKQH